MKKAGFSHGKVQKDHRILEFLILIPLLIRTYPYYQENIQKTLNNPRETKGTRL